MGTTTTKIQLFGSIEPKKPFDSKPTPEPVMAQAPTMSMESAKPSESSKAKQAASLSIPGGWWFWCLTGIALGLGFWLGGRYYLKEQLTAQLAEARSAQEAQQIILSLLKLDGDAAISIARGLHHPEFPVANASYRAITEQLDAWEALDRSEQLRRMGLLAKELQTDSSKLSQDHQMLICSLASTMYADCYSSTDAAASEILQLCKRVVSGTQLSSSTGNQEALTVADNPPDALPPWESAPTSLTSSGESTRLRRRSLSDLASEPPSPVPPPLSPSPALLPADSANGSLRDEFTDSSESLSSPVDSVQSPEASVLDQALNTVPPRNALRTGGVTGRATVHLTASSSSPVQAEPPMTSITLSDNPAPVESSVEARVPTIASSGALEGESILSEADAQTISGIDQLPIDRQVRLLASVQPKIAQAAVYALRKKGMPEDKLELAMALATGSEQDRLRMLEEIAARSDLDPRPWLAWMAEEGQTSVRRRAVAVLSTMPNEEVRRQLRLQLNRERDEDIAQAIRRVLISSNAN